MPKICPCSGEVTNDNFLFYVLIIDLVLNLPSFIGLVLTIVGLCINHSDKNWESGFFNCYAWFKVIMSWIIIVAFIGVLIYIGIFMNVITALIVFAIFGYWVYWNYYLST